MAKNIIGLDISDSSIEALALEKHRGNFTVESYSRFRLSPDIVANGRILDKEKLKRACARADVQDGSRQFCPCGTALTGRRLQSLSCIFGDAGGGA